MWSQLGTDRVDAGVLKKKPPGKRPSMLVTLNQRQLKHRRLGW